MTTATAVPSGMPTNFAPHQGKHIIVTVPAEAQLAMRVYPDGTVTVVQALVVPDQFVTLTVDRHAETPGAEPADETTAQAAIDWVAENDWPELELSADGVNRDCAVCMVCGGCACDQSLAMSEVYPEGVPVCAEDVAEHYERLAAETAEAEAT